MSGYERYNLHHDLKHVDVGVSEEQKRNSTTGVAGLGADPAKVADGDDVVPALSPLFLGQLEDFKKA